MNRRLGGRWRRKKIRNSMKAAAVFFVSMLLVFAAGCKSEETPASSLLEENLNTFAEGTKLAGENISGKTLEQGLAAGQAFLSKTMDAFEISVKFKDDTVVLKGTDFTSQHLLELVLPKMLAARKPGDYEIDYVMDLSAVGKQKIIDAAANCFAEGKNASVETFDTSAGEFVFTKEVNGVKANVDKTLKNIRQVLSQKQSATIQAEFSEEKATVTAEDLKKKFTKISSYSTVSGNTENGNSNMKLALSRINGTVLEPGQVFSYNGTLGDSTDPDNGWLPANGIAGGVFVQMYGGGICQGSSTLYVAVLLAGLDIVERHCHSMESTYVPAGQDATVDYGNLDFKFENSLKNPIYIASWMDGVTLHIEIYGVQPEGWDNIEVYSERVDSYNPLTTAKFQEDVSLASGAYQVRSRGNYGSSAVCSRTFYKNGEAVKTESMPDSYYAPTGRVYAVGPGTDTSKVDTTLDSGTTITATAPPTPAPTAAPAATPVPTSEPTPVPEVTPQPDPPLSSAPEEPA